ncbi:hypothetical protein DRJ22_02610 [Candidatus Woesearchaeota archaeon]|nr:MAG: hypothetical protein B6U93_02745 [Candidatus Woesearchaeota archaeon ex4484_78]RLE46165.1 MAG: hypothetical protein DRJ22_02610 [Candidatus Woesearchaeota archaeon]
MFEHILKKYGINQIKKTEKLNITRVNEAYKIKTEKGNFFLKKNLFPLTKKQLNFKFDLMLHLDQKKFPVILPIKTKKGDSFVKLKTRTYEVYPWIDNLKEYNTFKGQAYEKRYNQAVKLLADFHKDTKNFKTKNTAHTEPTALKDITAFYEEDKRKKHTKKTIPPIMKIITTKTELDKKIHAYKDELKQLIKEVAKYIKKRKKEKKRIVHYDFNPTNIVFKDNEKKPYALLDFEFSHYDLIELDIIKAAKFFSETNSGKSININKFKKFINTYKKYNNIKLKKEDAYYMTLFIVLRRLIYTLQYRYFINKKFKFSPEKDFKCTNYIIKNKNKFLKIK